MNSVNFQFKDEVHIKNYEENEEVKETEQNQEIRKKL